MDTVKGLGEAAAKVVEAVADKLTDAGAPPLPESRPELLALHRAARARRDAAPLMSKDRREAAYDIERIEIQVARLERAMDPPLV